MSDGPDALTILSQERQAAAPTVPADLVADIYKIEERLQFTDPKNRSEIQLKIYRLVQHVLDVEFVLTPINGAGETDGNGNAL